MHFYDFKFENRLKMLDASSADYIFKYLFNLKHKHSKVQKYIYFIRQILHFVTLFVISNVFFVLINNFMLISAKRSRASGVRGGRASIIIYFIVLIISLCNTRRIETSAAMVNHRSTSSGGDTEEGAEEIKASEARHFRDQQACKQHARERVPVLCI